MYCIPVMRQAAAVFFCTASWFVKEHNQKPKPFTWTADPNKIIASVKRGFQALDSNH